MSHFYLSAVHVFQAPGSTETRRIALSGVALPVPTLTQQPPVPTEADRAQAATFSAVGTAHATANWAT